MEEHYVVMTFIKAEFVVSHSWLLEDLEHLYRIQVLSRKFSSSLKSHDSPQGKLAYQPNKVKLICLFANSVCEPSNILKENIFLRSELVMEFALLEASNFEEELGWRHKFTEEIGHVVSEQGIV